MQSSQEEIGVQDTAIFEVCVCVCVFALQTATGEFSRIFYIFVAVHVIAQLYSTVTGGSGYGEQCRRK